MEEVIKTIEKNKRLFFIVLAAAMVVLLSVCPVVDVAGKTTENGLSVLFKGTGLGFPRFVMLLMFVTPLVILINQFIDLKLKENLKANIELVCFAFGIFLFILFVVTLNDLLSAAVGAYLYLLLSILGVVVSYILTTGKN